MFKQNIWKEVCLKKHSPPKNVFLHKIYQKYKKKNEMTSIYLKNWAGIKWPLVVDMP